MPADTIKAVQPQLVVAVSALHRLGVGMALAAWRARAASQKQARPRPLIRAALMQSAPVVEVKTPAGMGAC